MGDDDNHLTQFSCKEGDIPSVKLFNEYENILFDLRSNHIDAWEPNSIKFMSFELIEDIPIPNENKILSIYPNPFNPNTTISINVTLDSHVKADIIDIHGNLVKELVNDYYEKGSITVSWKPESVSSSMYLVKLSMGEFHLSKKIIYLK